MKNPIGVWLKRRGLRTVAVVAVLLVLGGVWIALSVSEEPGVVTTSSQVTSAPMEITVTGPGRIRARDAVVIKVPDYVDGELQVISLIPEGTVVGPGEIVAKLDTVDAATSLESEVDNLATAEEEYTQTLEDQMNQIRNLENSVRSAQLSFQQAELQLKNLEFSSDIERQQGALNVAKAQISLDESNRRLTAQKTINAAEIEQVLIQLEGRRLEVEEARNELAALTIRAPIGGLVIHSETGSFDERRKIVDGDQLRRGQNIMELPDLSVLQATVTINELDAERVMIGQSARIRLEAYPRAIFDGHVTDISTLAQETADQGNVRVFPAVVTLDGADDRVRPGMSASAEIIVGRVESVLQVPLAAIGLLDGQPHVMKESGGTLQRVELGLRNDSVAEVLSGLSPGEKVMLDWSRDPGAVLRTLAGNMSLPAGVTEDILALGESYGVMPPVPGRQMPGTDSPTAGRGSVRGIDLSQLTPEQLQQMRDRMGGESPAGAGRFGGARQRPAMSDSARTASLLQRNAQRIPGLPEALRTELTRYMAAGAQNYTSLSQALRDTLDAWQSAGRTRRSNAGPPPPGGDPNNGGVDLQ